MELDSRIEEGKEYLDCFKTEEAKKFIGKECYFSDGPAAFANVDTVNKATLISVDAEAIHPYKLENVHWSYATNLILPCEWVKGSKKYRPYTLEEFKERFNVGWIIRFRGKRSGKKYHIVLNGYIEYPDGDALVIMGHIGYTLKELFDEFEWIETGEEGYHPFGVEE